MTSEPEHAEVDLAHLHEPTSKNPNVMSSEDFTILTAAIRREGFLQPVLARPRLIERGGSYEIIDGVHRCKAAAAAGLVSVPCIIVDVDDDTAVMLRIAMNKLRGELDLATVARQVEALRADHSIEDLLVTGYTEKALKDLLEMAAEDRPEDALATYPELIQAAVDRRDDRDTWLRARLPVVNPVVSYRFLLDEAEFFIMNFIKGPVCRGQMALDVIEDRFWVYFVDPASGAAAGGAELIARQAADLAMHQQTRAMRNTPRWEQATKDVNLKFPEAAGVFSCALDMPISQEATPHLNMLLRRSLIDAGLATYKAKDHHNRQRPFAQLGESTCAPKEEAQLAKDGSYPSGHAALGWAWGLILSGVAHDRADALLQRAYAFGDSRMVCGVHWQSDVEAGRVVGAAAVARLQSDPVFLAQAQLAKTEIAAARAQGLKPNPTACAAEAIALQR